MKYLTCFAVPLLVLLFTGVAAAQLTMYDDNGTSDNRIDFLILSEGYTAGEAAKFQTDAAWAIEAIFEESPFRDYRELFNIGFGFVPSNQSGADATPTSNSVDTALQCHFWCNNTDRLICCSGDVWTIAADLYPAFDEVLVIVNSATYGGSGGEYSISSMADDAIDIPAHEFGHSLGNLADEYTYTYNLTCGEDYANITQDTNRATLKWGVWVDSQTPLPTTSHTSDLKPVGAFQGGCYSETDYYRPVWNCMMQSLGVRFCPVCKEQLIKSFYSRVEPVDSWLPVETVLDGTSGESISFSLGTVPLAEGQFSFLWELDAVSIEGQNGPSLTLPLNCVSPGSHELKAIVRDTTTMVRNDPAQKLAQNLTWSITRTDTGTTDTDCLLEPDTASDEDTSSDTATDVDSADTESDSESSTGKSSSDDGCGCRAVGVRNMPPTTTLQLILSTIHL